MSYTKTTWVNDSAPALNANNLNNIEDGIEKAYGILDVADTASVAASSVVDIIIYQGSEKDKRFEFSAVDTTGSSVAVRYSYYHNDHTDTRAYAWISVLQTAATQWTYYLSFSGQSTVSSTIDYKIWEVGG